MTSCTDVPTDISPALYRAIFKSYAAGVAVITADAGAGPVGFTATSLASISLDPPLVSFALSTSASSWPTVAVADTVVVNVLDATHDEIAQRFATSGINRFASPTRWSRLVTGEPVLTDAPSQLLGRVLDRHPVGDHHLVVAHITHATTRAHAPLVYHSGRYHTVGQPQPV